MASSLVNNAKAKNVKCKQCHLCFLVCRKFKKNKKDESMKIAKRESFLPEIQATAWVSKGWTVKSKEENDEIKIVYFNFFNNVKTKHEANICKIKFVK